MRRPLPASLSVRLQLYLSPAHGLLRHIDAAYELARPSPLLTLHSGLPAQVDQTWPSLVLALSLGRSHEEVAPFEGVYFSASPNQACPPSPRRPWHLSSLSPAAASSRMRRWRVSHLRMDTAHRLCMGMLVNGSLS
jgi:hypothetical protein